MRPLGKYREPKTATIAITIEGVRVRQIKISGSQASRLSRGITQARKVWERGTTYELREPGRTAAFEEDLADVFIAALHHEFGA